MEQGPTEKVIIEQCYRQGLPLPEPIANAPELLLGLSLYYTAFMDLTSCRASGYGTEGPIPWTTVREWADRHELDDEQIEDLEYHIPRMDETYLKFKAKKMTKPTSPAKRTLGTKRGK